MKFTILAIPYMRGRGETVHLPGSDPQRFQVLMDRLKEQMQFAEGEHAQIPNMGIPVIGRVDGK